MLKLQIKFWSIVRRLCDAGYEYANAKHKQLNKSLLERFTEYGDNL